MSGMGGLSLKYIRKSYGDIRAVDNVSLDFADGGLTALLGPSGCGKTTLLRMIAGLEEPSAGSISLGGQDITHLPAHKRRFGMVFQSFALFPHLNVSDNVAYALTIAGMARGQAAARARELLDLVQLSAFADRRIGELSGGQRQRVAIARALAQEPDVFLLDEPMSALDAKLREDMQVELRQLQQRLGITTIVVTHDQHEAMTMADSIVVMSQGRVEQMGTPQTIYHHPENAFVADFIGKANFLDGVVQGGRVQVGDHLLEIAPPANFMDGSPVRLALRPEKAALGGASDAVNRISARVTFVRDVGPVRDIHLDTPVGRMVVAHAPEETGVAVRVGDALHVTLPAHAIHVFPRVAADRAAA